MFKEHCIASTYHPTWDKIYGNPAEPATSIVFGEKGSGKTAMRLQIAPASGGIQPRASEGSGVYVIEYDDFNPFLDRFRDKLGRAAGRRIDRVLAEWKLWDHMDAILSLGVTRLVDDILAGRAIVRRRRLASSTGTKPAICCCLAACYDQSLAETRKGRWHRLRRRLRFRTWWAQWDLGLGIAVTMAVAALVIACRQMGLAGHALALSARARRLGAVAVAHAGNAFGKPGHRPARARRQSAILNSLRQMLMNFTGAEITGQPLPNKERTDDRYELLAKFQGILQTLGFTRHRRAGRSGRRAASDQRLGRADAGPALADARQQVPQASRHRLQAAAADRAVAVHRSRGPRFFSAGAARQAEHDSLARMDRRGAVRCGDGPGRGLRRAGRQADAGRAVRPGGHAAAVDGRAATLRVPRHLFKFMYRLLVAHCNAYTDDDPAWQISSEMFESTLAVYRREQDAFDRGVGVV